MAEIKKLAPVLVQPGIKRDGTVLDSDHYTDGQWVRFQRARPKKIGGFSEISSDMAGPVRQALVWSRGLLNTLYTFSPAKIEMSTMDANGLGGFIYDRTPSGFMSNVDHIWSVDTMFDDAVGSEGTIVIAHPSKSLANIDDDTDTQVYYGLASNNAAFEAITGMTVSGGVVSVGPYLVYFGSDGFVGWTDVNQPQTLTGGDAGSDRVTGAKVVKGLPLRSSQGPAALLWSLDALLIMQWVGGEAIFRFTTVSGQTSILSQNSVIEYDGAYFWIGVDRFLSYSGGQVNEIPNQLNQNWFFDHLDYTRRQKVWAMKVPRYGEIWWFYPRDEATECSHAIILNIREKTWYDIELGRSAGFYSQVFRYPVMADSETTGVDRLTITTGSGSFNVGNTITGTSGATGLILSIPSSGVYRVEGTNETAFITGETITNLSVAGSGTLTAQADLYSTFTHEKGTDAIVGEIQNAIESYFTTSDFGLPAGGPSIDSPPVGATNWTRLVRIEPDFVMSGEMSVEVIGREFAQSSDVSAATKTFSSTTEYVDLRTQARQIRLKFTSNDLGGDYEMGRTLLHTEPGDGRS